MVAFGLFNVLFKCFEDSVRVLLRFVHELYLYASLIFFLTREHLMVQFIRATSNEVMDVDDTTLWSSTMQKISYIAW